MAFKLRDYQSKAIEDVLNWFNDHTGVPLVVLPTGAGKSVVIAELIKQLWELWGNDYPRTLVIVPSKELAEQNADKLVHILPQNISVGFYSASVGRKDADKDVIVGTIGSVAKNAHLLGNIKCVIIDEAHLISNHGTGQFRTFLQDLSKYCKFITLGMTATPFRGNGVWLTDGKDPLFTAIAHTTNIQTLLNQGHLSPLVLPADVITAIDTSDIRLSNGDYVVEELSKRVSGYLDNVVTDVLRLAQNRKKWIAFTPTVQTAEDFAKKLNVNGVKSGVVTGDLNKTEREQRINDFRNGDTRCLVTVLALATGFDVPSVDCIIWCRPTKSPVLYIQGAGRGMRIAPGKTDCLWLDFSDTTKTLGTIDTIKGRAFVKGRGGDAPFAVCNNCATQVRPASTKICPECGFQMRTDDEDTKKSVSDAAILSTQIKNKVFDITNVAFFEHKKDGRPSTLRVEYFSGLIRVATEWIAFEHTGFARQKAAHWWANRSDSPLPNTVADALLLTHTLLKPTTLEVSTKGKYPEIIRYGFG